MPRMNLAVVRTTVVALTLAVLLLGQAAQALSLAPRPTLAAPATADTIASLWSWITGRIVATLNPSTSVALHPKTGGVSDPAGSSQAQGIFVPGVVSPLP